MEQKHLVLHDRKKLEIMIQAITEAGYEHVETVPQEDGTGETYIYRMSPFGMPLRHVQIMVISSLVVAGLVLNIHHPMGKYLALLMPIPNLVYGLMSYLKPPTVIIEFKEQ